LRGIGAFASRACLPYRPLAKGEDERDVGYVKKAHLDERTREVADKRIHSTTGETPIERFMRVEAAVLSAQTRRASPSRIGKICP
jgi:hypothetical protein